MEEKKKELEEAVQILIKLLNPITMYVFGSQVWGVPRKGSDIDICVVVEDGGYNRIEQSQLAIEATKHIDADLDIFVQSEKLIKNSSPLSLQHKIKVKGRCIYQREKRL